MIVGSIKENTSLEKGVQLLQSLQKMLETQVKSMSRKRICGTSWN